MGIDESKDIDEQAGDDGDPTNRDVRDALKSLQRLHRVTGALFPIPSSVEAGFVSAADIAQADDDRLTVGKETSELIDVAFRKAMKRRLVETFESRLKEGYQDVFDGVVDPCTGRSLSGPSTRSGTGRTCSGRQRGRRQYLHTNRTRFLYTPWPVETTRLRGDW